MESLITFAGAINDSMEHLKYYRQIAADLEKNEPEKFERLEEEVRIIIHKLKFIPVESRPLVELVYPNTAVAPIPSYIEELLELAGAQINPLLHVPDQIPTLIFVDPSPQFVGQLPELLAHDFSDYKAVTENQVYLINKSPFAQSKTDYLLDSEILAEIVQSKYFIFGHEGQHWIKFDLRD